MKIRKEKNTTLKIVLLLAFLVMAIAIFSLLDSRKQHSQEQHLQLITERYEFDYNIIYDQCRKLATNVSIGIIERYDIPKLYQQLLTADRQEKNRLRAQLFAEIQPRYEKLKKNGGVRHLHFHLRNNESFLRLHRPEKYGDNLTNIRETVNYVNTAHLPVDGFEEGKINNGYRFVFPVKTADNTHLGSMEVSFGAEFLTSALMKQYAVFSNFFIKASVVKNKVFTDEIAVNYKKSHHKGYLFDRHVLAELKKKSDKEMTDLKPQQSITDAILVNANSGKAISLYDPSIDRVFTTIPVFTPINKEMVAFLTVRSQSVFFKNENRYFSTIFSLSLMLLLMGFSTFYVLYNKRIILEGSAEQLEKQKQQLVDAQNIANLGHWEIDLIDKHLSWSDQIFRIFDVSPQAFIVTVDSFMERVHPDDRDFVSTAYADAVENHQPYDIQHRIITSNGTEKWVREICSTEYDKAGEPLRSLGVVHDITEQHNILALLQQKHDMFMHGPVMIFTWQNRENWPVEYVSENVCDTLGFSANEFLEGSVQYRNIIHPDDLQRVINEVAEHSGSAGNNFVHEPYRLISRDGEPVWVLDTTSMLRDSQGGISHFQGYLVDITQTMVMRDEAFESKNRLDLVIEGASLGTWDWNIATGEEFHNERWAEILGYTLDEVRQDIFSWKNFIHPDDAEEFQEKFTDYLAGRTSVYKTEHRLQHKSGKWVWVLDVGKVLERDEKGRPQRVVGIILDITGNKEAAQTLFTSKEQEYMQRYIGAIDDIGLGLCVIDADYRVRDMNKTMIGWFGDQRGKICFESVAGLEKPCPYCCLRDVIDKGNTIKYQPVTPDGRSFDIVAIPLVNSEGTVSKMEIIRDITEQEQVQNDLIATNSQLEEAISNAEKMAEKAEEANHAKSVFLSTMGHELRTPLNAILGYTQIFSEDTSLSQKVQMGVKTIQQSGEHLLLLLNDILDLSKIEAGKMELMKTEFRLPEFLQGIMGIIRVRAEEKGIDCYYTSETSIPAIIETDELRLRQVILNLLSNAVKFTDTGHCTLCIRSRPAGKDKALLTFIIEDSGIGIVSEMQEKIFEVFQQTGQRLKFSEGYGLGLSISRKLVRLMGGDVELVSPIYEQTGIGDEPGSRFSFTIEVGSSGELLEPLADQLHPELLHADQSEILAPPQELLDTLITLAKSGDINGISEESLVILLMENGKYKEFSMRIKRLADKFKLIEIVKFVTRYKRD